MDKFQELVGVIGWKYEGLTFQSQSSQNDDLDGKTLRFLKFL